jgi:hypothetical protein
MFIPFRENQLVRTLGGRPLGALDKPWSDPDAQIPGDLSAISREVLRKFGCPLYVARYTAGCRLWDHFLANQKVLPYLARAGPNDAVSKFGADFYQHPPVFLGMNWGNIENETWISGNTLMDHQILLAPKIPGEWIRFDKESGCPTIINPDVVVIVDVVLPRTVESAVA